MRSAILILLVGAGSAAADILVFTNGKRLEGVVTPADAGYTLETPNGWVLYPRHLVASVVSGDIPLAVHRRRLAALLPEDLDGRADLAAYCERHGLGPQAEELYLSILRADPEHAPARQKLGFLRLEDSWVTRDEALRRLGLVEVGSGWATPAVATELGLRGQDLERVHARLTGLERANRALTSRLTGIQQDRDETSRRLETELIEARGEIRRLRSDLSRRRRPALYSLGGPVLITPASRPFVFPPPHTGPRVVPNPGARRKFLP